MIRGTKLLSRRSEGAISTTAVWFTTRSRRVKLGILILAMLLIWLCGITLPAALINELSANLNGGNNDAGFAAYAQGSDDNDNSSFLLPGVRENGAVAALPFVETVTPTATSTPTPTDTPTIIGTS